MALSTQATANMRDRIHNLDINELEEDKKYYQAVRRQYIYYCESKRHLAYDDRKGNITIGLGFNMNRAEARSEWQAAFGINEKGEENILFDEVYAGKRQLSDEEINTLADSCLATREKELKRYYKTAWHKLKPNEKIAIESAYYSSPKIVRGAIDKKPATQFFTNMVKYVDTSDEQFLQQAIYELEHRSNHGRGNVNVGKGLQNRRNSEAEMLSSHKCPLYAKPGQPSIPHKNDLNKPFKARLAKTYVPRNNYAIYFQKYLETGKLILLEPWTLVESPYYIWRTVGDDRVRKTHRENEGLVFRKDSILATGKPGDEHGCRCFAEKLPEHLTIIE